MKPSLLLASAAAAVLLSSCCSQTTLENRRDMYFPQKVNGPYTRMAAHGIPKVKTTVVTTTERQVTTAPSGK